MQDPGHGGRGLTVVVVFGYDCGFGGLVTANVVRVLSQHILPFWQFDVRGIKTSGLVQKPIIIVNRQ